MFETRNVTIEYSDLIGEMSAESVIHSAFEKIFPDFTIEIDYDTREGTSTFGRLKNSRIFLTDIKKMFEDVESLILNHDWKSVRIEDCSNFPMEYPIRFYNFFKDKDSLRKISTDIEIEIRHFEKIKNSNFRFQLALEMALSEHLKPSCQVNVKNTPVFSSCPTCGRGHPTGYNHSVSILDKENFVDMEVVSNTDEFQLFVKKINKKDFKPEGISLNIEVPKMFLSEYRKIEKHPWRDLF